MNVFITKDGQRVEVERFMQGPKLSAGYVWNNDAPLGSGEKVWREVVAPHVPDGKLFGYDQAEFMAKQYR